MEPDISAYLLDLKNQNQTTKSFKVGDYVDILDTSNLQLVFVNTGSYDQKFTARFSNASTQILIGVTILI